MKLNELDTGPQEHREYFDNGNLKEHYYTVNGKREGGYKSFYRNGNLSVVSHYTNDKLDGEFIHYNPDGQTPLEIINWRQGERDGEYKSYHYKTTQLEKHAFYKNGKLHGDFKYYSKDGELETHYEYENGDRVKALITKPI